MKEKRVGKEGGGGKEKKEGIEKGKKEKKEERKGKYIQPSSGLNLLTISSRILCFNTEHQFF